MGTDPFSVAVGDFNGDGIEDLAVANVNYEAAISSTVSALLGVGDGTFQPAVSYGVGVEPAAVVVGFNGDGKPDLGVANYYDATLSILLGKGDGTFQPQIVIYPQVGSLPTAMAAGDLNGDGKQDLVVAGKDKWVSVILGNGDGTFQPALNYMVGTDPYSVAVGDFNGDGKLDVAVATLLFLYCVDPAGQRQR